MAQERFIQQKENTYVIDPEQAVEMHRLKIQNEVLTEAMGGNLPEFARELPAMQRVLDLACGPGDWALGLAKKNPQLEVVGVDISTRMIGYARSRKEENTRFELMDITEPLDLPDNYFDIVNARLLAAVLKSDVWPVVLRECLRVLKPGGYLRLAEPEYAQTNGAACEELGWLAKRILLQRGQSFSPDGRNVGLTLMLGKLLMDAGFVSTQHRAFAIDFSVGSQYYQSIVEDLKIAYLLSQPFFLQGSDMSKDELMDLYNRAVQEMQSSDFRGLWFYLVAWGQKPLH